MKVDRSKDSRTARYRELRGLDSLPFMSKEQVKRWRWLKKQVVMDNRAAFEEAKKPA